MNGTAVKVRGKEYAEAKRLGLGEVRDGEFVVAEGDLAAIVLSLEARRAKAKESRAATRARRERERVHEREATAKLEAERREKARSDGAARRERWESEEAWRKENGYPAFVVPDDSRAPAEVVMWASMEGWRRARLLAALAASSWAFCSEEVNLFFGTQSRGWSALLVTRVDPESGKPCSSARVETVSESVWRWLQATAQRCIDRGEHVHVGHPAEAGLPGVDGTGLRAVAKDTGKELFA